MDKKAKYKVLKSAKTAVFFCSIHTMSFIGLNYMKVLFLSCFSIITLKAYNQSYNFHNFKSEDGIPDSYIYNITQDDRGYLWIGTGNGLSKYNGFTFENYTTNDSLADNFISCAISDSRYLWLGHMNGNISCFNGKKFHHLTVSNSNGSPITHLAKSSEGTIWASTYTDGLLLLGKENGVLKRIVFKEPVIINTFEFLNNREMLIGGISGLSYCKFKESGEVEVLRLIPEIPESKIVCIKKMRSKNGYYIATENEGIFQLIDNSSQFNVNKIITDLISDYTGVQDLIEDSQSNIWISTFGNGLIKMNYNKLGQFTRESFNLVNGFVTDNIKTIFEDRDGNIWSGNYGEGLTKINPKTFTIYTFDKLKYGNDIFSFYIDQHYRWIGTGAGLIKADKETGKIIKFYSKNNHLPKDTITSLYSGNGKELWIGTDKNGLFRMDLDDEKIQKYPLENGALENSINLITGKGEQVWIGTKKGLYNVSTVSKKVKWYSISQGGLPHNYINYLYLDRKSRLWISTKSNTLVYIKDGKVYKTSINSHGKLPALGPITEDKNSRIWVGSSGNGVYMVEPDSAINITIKDGLLSNYCYSIVCDEKNNLWVGHKSGLSMIRTHNFSVKPIERFVDKTDSYQFNSNAIHKDIKGKIWFGTNNGAVLYNTSIKYSKFLPPVLSITSVKINDEEKDFTDKIVLSSGIYKIRIDFLGINLKEPELVTYQYKLEGYEQWSDITKNTSAIYNHLLEGNYMFILKAYSGDGEVTEKPVTLLIVIKEPVWKKWWFYFLLFTLLIIFSIIYIKRREYKYIFENEVLEEKVRERTYEIECQKNEIEEQRDIIDRKNLDITSSIKLASHIQNAVLPSIDLIREFLPGCFILNRPKDIVSGDFYWVAQKTDKIIFTVADCTGHGVPGAFTSLLGISLLNEIVNMQRITQSDKIVTRLRERVTHSLHQNPENIIKSVAIDIALCVWDQSRNVIQYTGGITDIVYIRNGNLEVVKADRISISYLTEESSLFTMKEINVRKGDMFYLFSDGYKDQFGGKSDKKYLKSRFYNTLLEIHSLPIDEQEELLKMKLYDWMNGTEQTDDITVMGIRL